MKALGRVFGFLFALVVAYYFLTLDSNKEFDQIVLFNDMDEEYGEYYSS